MDVRMEASWKTRLKQVCNTSQFAALADFVRQEYTRGAVYPPPGQLFRAFALCPFDAVKVVILGQDPYHGPGQANGLCFAVGEGVTLPPSLQNIYKEIENDLGKEVARRGDLERWACQGVLLLNATLTVRKGQPGSHRGKGWEEFTNACVQTLAEEREHIVFMLWGRYAKEKGRMVDPMRHCVLEAAHPSPFSADKGFFGCKHFSKANEYLRAHGKEPIEW